MKLALDILLDHFTWLDIQVPKPRRTHDPVVAGVYALVADDQIVYVGSSFHICSRVRAHLSGANCVPSGRKEFDSVIYTDLPRDLADLYEAALVRFLRPRYNAPGWVAKDQSADAEILFGLGLTDSLSESDVAWEEVA